MDDSSKQNGFYIKVIAVLLGMILLVELAGLVEMRTQVESDYSPARVYTGTPSPTTLAPTTSVKITTTTVWHNNDPCQSPSGICCDMDYSNGIDASEMSRFIRACGGDPNNQNHRNIANGLGNLCSCDEFKKKI